MHKHDYAHSFEMMSVFFTHGVSLVGSTADHLLFTEAYQKVVKDGFNLNILDG